MGYSVQDCVLKEAQKNQRIVTIITINGYQMAGRIFSWDESALVVDGVDGKRNLVYKSAVSTIVLNGGNA